MKIFAGRGKANALLTKELLETVKDVRASGIMDKAAHEKITMRHLGAVDKIPKATISARCAKKAHLSQAVFARYLNLTAGYVSQLERGTKRPTGAALVMLNVIRRKGIQAIL